jgi:hypothetical protein
LSRKKRKRLLNNKRLQEKLQRRQNQYKRRELSVEKIKNL